MCYGQFGKMYRTSRGSKSNDKDEEAKHNEVDDNIDNNEDDHDLDGEAKFHYIMTADKSKKKLPDYIVLKNPQPRESPVMQKRNFPAVLRFNKVRQGDDPRKFMLHEVMLYRPLRCEVNLDNVEEMYDESINGQRKVDIVKGQVMEYLEGVKEARYYVDQVKKEIDLRETANKPDPAMEQIVMKKVLMITQTSFT